MNNIRLVDGIQSMDKARDKKLSDLLGELSLPCDVIPQVTTQEKVHDEVEIHFVLKCVVTVHDKVALYFH